MAEKRQTVLIVEDNEMMRKLLAAELTKDGRYDVALAATGAEGLEKAVDSQCRVVVLDMMLPDTDGLQFIEHQRELRPDCPSIIAITGAPQSVIPDSIIEAPFRGQVSAVFRKPFDHAKLVETIAFCMQQ